MHEVEREVRDLLQERSQDVRFQPHLSAGLIRRVRRRRSLKMGAVGLSAVATIIAAVAAVQTLPIPPDGAPLAGPTPSLEKAVPSTFVGQRKGELLLVSTADGEVLRVIADRATIGTDVPGDDITSVPTRPAVAPDGSAVFFANFRRGVGAHRLTAVPMKQGGGPEDLGWGSLPAVDPAGDRLAYRSCTQNECGKALVIRDLTTGAERRVESGDPDLQVGPPVWLLDGRVVVALYPPMDGSSSRYQVIDPNRPPDLLVEAPSIPLPPRGIVRWGPYGHYSFRGGIVVGQMGRRPSSRERFVSIDPDTGKTLGTVPQGNWERMYPDASGNHLLLLDPRGRVFVARGGGGPQQIAAGFSDVAW